MARSNSCQMEMPLSHMRRTDNPGGNFAGMDISVRAASAATIYFGLLVK
jgi:hypothetical protein